MPATHNHAPVSAKETLDCEFYPHGASQGNTGPSMESEYNAFVASLGGSMGGPAAASSGACSSQKCLRDAHRNMLHLRRRLLVESRSRTSPSDSRMAECSVALQQVQLIRPSSGQSCGSGDADVGMQVRWLQRVKDQINLLAMLSCRSHLDLYLDPDLCHCHTGSVRPPRVGDDLPDDCKLYVGNIGQDVGEEALRAAFAPYGTVLHVVIPKVRIRFQLKPRVWQLGLCWQTKDARESSGEPPSRLTAPSCTCVIPKCSSGFGRAQGYCPDTKVR